MSEKIRNNAVQILVLGVVVLTMPASNVFAQYKGGSGDGYASGHAGGTLPGVAVSTGPAPTEMPKTFSLSAVYPNPFSRQASLTLTVYDTQRVQFELCDLLGRCSVLEPDRVLVAHQRYRLRIEGRHLSPGLYIVRVAGEHFSASRSVTLVD